MQLRESKQGNGSGRGGTSEQDHPVLGRGDRRAQTHGMELVKDCLQEKMDICPSAGVGREGGIGASLAKQ